MTKIEQLAELLVSELKGFEKGIAKLEALETKMRNSEVKIDLMEFKSLKQYHENAMSESNKVHESYLHRLQSVVKGASFYPKWAIITFMSMILMCCLISFYAYTVKADAIEKEKAAYANGEKTATEYINLYLSENPKALEQYKKWTETK